MAAHHIGGVVREFLGDFTEANRLLERCRELQRRWPATMLTTSTHDTKRSEDVRARLYLLSEIPGEWSANPGITICLLLG